MLCPPHEPQGFARDIPDLSSLKQELVAESGRFKERASTRYSCGQARGDPRVPEPGRQGARTVRRQVGLLRGRGTGLVGAGRSKWRRTGTRYWPHSSRYSTTRLLSRRGVPERRIHTQTHASLHRLRETRGAPLKSLFDRWTSAHKPPHQENGPPEPVGVTLFS